MDGKSYVLENIIQNYRIKDEEKVTSETIYQILENTRITIQELKKCLGIPKNTEKKLIQKTGVWKGNISRDK